MASLPHCARETAELAQEQWPLRVHVGLGVDGRLEAGLRHLPRQRQPRRNLGLTVCHGHGHRRSGALQQDGGDALRRVDLHWHLAKIRGDRRDGGCCEHCRCDEPCEA